MKDAGIFWGRENNTGIFWVLYSSSAQINYNISAIYSFVFDQNQRWSWHVLAFQKIKNKICWCKNTEGFFWVTNSEVGIFLGIKYVGPPVIKICEWGPWGKWPPSSEKIWKRVWISGLGVNGVWCFWWDSGQGLETGQHTPPPRIPWTNLSGVSRYSKWSTTASKLSNGELSSSITV